MQQKQTEPGLQQQAVQPHSVAAVQVPMLGVQVVVVPSLSKAWQQTLYSMCKLDGSRQHMLSQRPNRGTPSLTPHASSAYSVPDRICSMLSSRMLTLNEHHPQCTSRTNNLAPVAEHAQCRPRFHRCLPVSACRTASLSPAQRSECLQGVRMSTLPGGC